MSKLARTRRKRRSARAAQRKGPHARSRHKLQAGRTGSVHSKKTQPKTHVAYIATSARGLAESVQCAECGARPGEIHQHNPQDPAP